MSWLFSFTSGSVSSRRRKSSRNSSLSPLSAGAEIAGALSAALRKVNPRFLIGTGKLEELRQFLHDTCAEIVLVDHRLSPAQQRNLEQKLDRRVIDRTGLILDIFAQRARTHEGKLQVELAQLEHLATRLVRGWTHLERQKGGIGLRGPGETQLETDRRLIGQRIRSLTERLGRVSRQRRTSGQEAAQGGDPDCFSRRVHECRQVHLVQPADQCWRTRR